MTEEDNSNKFIIPSYGDLDVYLNNNGDIVFSQDYFGGDAQTVIVDADKWQKIYDFVKFQRGCFLASKVEDVEDV